VKATGIVRRMDELGRIVIPREIRKYLRIRQGEPMEIYTTPEGEVVFRKYSPFAAFPDFMEDVVNSLSNAGRCTVAACDRERVLLAAGPQKATLADMPVPDEWQPAMEKRKAAAVENWYVVPVLDDGDVPGALVFSREDPRAEEYMVSMTNFCAGLISRHLEV